MLEVKSLQMNFNSLSCIVSILFVLAWLQKCHVWGQQLKFEMIKDLKIVNFPCFVRNLPMRLSTASCWEAFL